MHRCGLRDDQWERIKDFLPGREGHVGGTAVNNRLFVEAVLYRYRAGIPWRDFRSGSATGRTPTGACEDGARAAFSRVSSRPWQKIATTNT